MISAWASEIGMRCILRLASDRQGTTAIELALVLPLLVLALCGILQFGFNLHNKQQLQAAVQAGLQYALRNPSDTTGVQQAVSGALPSGVGVVVETPTYTCECNNGAPLTCSASAACASGTPRRIMKVAVSRPPANWWPKILGEWTSRLHAEGHIAVPLL